MFLAETKEKQSYKIIKIQEGKQLKLQLTARGLLPGTILRIIKNDGLGPLILAIKATRISIGRGLASKIEVVEL